MATINLGFRYVRHDTFDKVHRKYKGRVVDVKTNKVIYQTIPYTTREQCGADISHWIQQLCPKSLSDIVRQWALPSGICCEEPVPLT